MKRLVTLPNVKQKIIFIIKRIPIWERLTYKMGRGVFNTKEKWSGRIQKQKQKHLSKISGRKWVGLAFLISIFQSFLITQR